ncbi:MAG: methylated-DNA--[protein]-cysteine S-methyltransferase [Candidatus Krumholzibacteriota bacterium]|nr:methylated-DNA--[protein]-cysteine S-methyltransferase [Candidatus Krumholzibacteriota bacterium]
MEKRIYRFVDSPVGLLFLGITEGCLSDLSFAAERGRFDPGDGWKKAREPFRDIVSQLEAYFGGELKRFDIPLLLRGTGFQRSAWSELLRIPYGKTISYGEQARRMGNPKACRAVGGANRANPVAVIVPCHRVIGKSGRLTGFGGGLPIKEQLLALEKASGFIPL